MRAKWKIKPLGELCDILDSKRKPITKKDRTSGEFPYYGATGILDYVEDYIFDEKLVLIGEDGAKWGAGENTAFAAEGKYWVNNHAHVIRPHRGIVLDKWIIYHLNAYDLSPFITGLTVPKLNQAKLRDIPIPLVPLPEQKRIVAILDEAFEGIGEAVANAEKNLANARELFERYLNSIFTQKGKGWVERKLGEIGKTQYGLSEKMNENGSGFKIFRMGEVQNGQLIDTGMMKYADITQDEFEKYKLYSGDVLFNRTNSYELVGKTGIFNLDGDYCFASYLVRLNFDRNKMTPGFLNYFMNSSIFQEKIKLKASRSINQANINATILSNENIQFPVSISEQQAIVRKLDALSSETQRLEAIYQQKLDSLAELKQAVLQKAFAGELTVQPEQFLHEAVA